MIVQACMVYTTDEGNSPGSDPDTYVTVHDTKNRHIVLKRRHTLLLNATVEGGKAIRGAYSGAIARQISKANGQLTIEDMHLAAIAEMEEMEEMEEMDDTQDPEKRDTLRHKLILPGKSYSTLTDNQVRQ